MQVLETKVRVLSLKVQLNYGQMTGKRKQDPVYVVLKDFVSSATSIKELNQDNITKVARLLKFTPEKLKTALKEKRIRVVEILSMSGPIGLNSDQ